MTDREISSGADILGALLMGHPYKSWWTGSILSIDESKKLAPGQNATTIQVALGVVSAVMWMIEHPKMGFCLPDDLPHEYVLTSQSRISANFTRAHRTGRRLRTGRCTSRRTRKTTTTVRMSGNSKTSYLSDEPLLYQIVNPRK